MMISPIVSARDPSASHRSGGIAVACLCLFAAVLLSEPAQAQEISGEMPGEELSLADEEVFIEYPEPAGEPLHLEIRRILLDDNVVADGSAPRRSMTAEERRELRDVIRRAYQDHPAR